MGRKKRRAQHRNRTSKSQRAKKDRKKQSSQYRKISREEFEIAARGKQIRRTTVSHAYVVFTSELFGGKVVDYNNEDYQHIGNPDIIRDNDKQTIEVKTSKVNMKIPTIKIPQVIEYENVAERIGYENYHVLWSFNEKTRANARTTVTHDTRGLLVLSLDVLSSLVDPIRDKSELYFGLVLDKNLWNRLLYRPEEGLAKLGLDAENYFIEEKVLEAVKYNQRWKVKPFNMTTIRNKNYHPLELLC